MELKNLLEHFFHTQENWKTRLLTTFPDIIGENLKHQVSLIKIIEPSVIIGVYNSCLLQELYVLTPLLLEKINQTLDIPRITRIQFRLQTAVCRNVSQILTNQDNSHSDVVQLTAADKLPLKNIRDQELASVLEAFRKRCYKEAQWKKR